MTGTQFLDALKAHIAPATITRMLGTYDGVDIELSDGRKVVTKRKKVDGLTTDADLNAYIARVLS